MLNQLTQAVAFPSNHNPSHTEAAADAATVNSLQRRIAPRFTQDDAK